MALGLGSAPASRAQTPVTTERVTLAAVRAPLADALAALIDQTGIQIAYESALVVGRTAFCRADRVPVEAALACVLRGTGLDFARLSSGTYVLLLDPEAPPRTGTLGGRVVDAETGAPLAGAHIVLAAHNGSEPPGAATTADGRFALADLLPGPHRLSVSYVGYQTATVRVEVEPGGTARLEVPLRSTPVLSRPVVVSGLSQRGLLAELGQGTVPGEALTGEHPTSEPDPYGDPLSPGDRAAPADAPLAVTPDVSAALDAVVGVSVGQALADVHVQGGSAGEHPLRLAGAPVFAPVSLGGLVGPFSPYAVERVVVHKAGFEADLGSHLAGVVDVEPLRAPLAGQTAVVEADALGVQGRWGGRAGAADATEASWVVTARQSNGGTGPAPLARRLATWNAPDPFLLDRLGGPDSSAVAGSAPVDLSFTDLHAAGRVRLGGLRTLSASLYGASHAFEPARSGIAGDNADDLYEDAYRWTNLTGSARYEGVLSGRTLAHAEAWASGFDLVRPSATTDTEAPDANAVSAGALSLGVEAAPSRRQWVSAGLEVTGYASEISVTSAGAAPPLTADALRPIRATVAAVASDRVDLSARTSLTVGTRATWLPETGRVYAEPRLAVRHDAPAGPLGAWSARAAAGLYRQFVGAYDAADAGFEDGAASVRYWLPVGVGQRPPLALHLAAEGVVQPGGPWTLRAEGYLKGQPHLLVLDRSPDGAGMADAHGHAWGLAARVEHRSDRLRLALGYERSSATLTQPGRFGGASVPAPWTVPHRLRLSADLTPARGLVLTARAEALAGRAWGFRQAYYDLLEPDPTLALAPPYSLSDPGAHRLPLFAQLDLGAAYSRVVGPARLQVRVGLVNAFGRDNVRDWRLEPDGAGAYRQVPRLALPRFPTAAIRVSF